MLREVLRKNTCQLITQKKNGVIVIYGNKTKQENLTQNLWVYHPQATTKWTKACVSWKIKFNPKDQIEA